MTDENNVLISSKNVKYI